MKKMFVLFAAIIAMFLLSADLHSSNEIGLYGERYCVYFWTGICYESSSGTACYLVDENCNWIGGESWPDL